MFLLFSPSHFVGCGFSKSWGCSLMSAKFSELSQIQRMGWREIKDHLLDWWASENEGGWSNSESFKNKQPTKRKLGEIWFLLSFYLCVLELCLMGVPFLNSSPCFPGRHPCPPVASPAWVGGGDVPGLAPAPLFLPVFGVVLGPHATRCPPIPWSCCSCSACKPACFR